MKRSAHFFPEGSVVTPFLLDKADSNQDHDTADNLASRTSQSFGLLAYAAPRGPDRFRPQHAWSQGAPNHP